MTLTLYVYGQCLIGMGLDEAQIIGRTHELASRFTPVFTDQELRKHVKDAIAYKRSGRPVYWFSKRYLVDKFQITSQERLALSMLSATQDRRDQYRVASATYYDRYHRKTDKRYDKDGGQLEALKRLTQSDPSLSRKQLAELLRCSESTISRLRRQLKQSP